MCKTKGLIVGATLPVLVLILSSISLACGANPSQAPTKPPPLVNEPAPPAPGTSPQLLEEKPSATEIPANYTTYIDESELFSISYPADWEITQPQMTPFGQNAKETINRLQADYPVEEFSVIFFGGKPDQGAYEPYVIIGVGPVPAEISTLDQLVDSDIQVDRETYSDFQELSRIKTTIDGKEATILDWEGNIPEEQYKLYCLQLYILTDKALWVLTCGSRPENAAQWENDFDNIVRSLRISN